MAFMRLTGLTIAAALTSTAAWANCGLSGGNINILGNDFGAINAVVDAARACEGDGVTFSSNLTTEHRDIQVADAEPGGIHLGHRRQLVDRAADQCRPDPPAG